MNPLIEQEAKREYAAIVYTCVLAIVALILLSGCSIQKYNRPPNWASVVDAKSRFFGLNASVPVSGSAFGIQLGWGSTTYTVLPVSTNEVFIPKFSDTFSVGQTVNPFDTRIREYLQTGWEGEATPPPAMMFAPKSP